MNCTAKQSKRADLSELYISVSSSRLVGIDAADEAAGVERERLTTVDSKKRRENELPRRGSDEAGGEPGFRTRLVGVQIGLYLTDKPQFSYAPTVPAKP